jgi:heptosyltransferase-2
MEGMSGYLVVGPSWVGDMVLAQSLLISLKECDPDLPIDVIAPSWSVAVAQRMTEVRDAIALPIPHRELGWSRRWSLARSLRSREYTQAIVLPRSLKSALVPWLAQIPKRTGYRGEWRYGLLNDIRKGAAGRSISPARRWFALGHPPDAVLPVTVPHPRLRPDPENQHRLIRALGLSIDGPLVALVPGGEHGSAKRWPVEYFATLARELAHRGITVWILGSARETVVAEAIAAQGGAVTNLCGRTTIPDAIDLLALANGVVCNDSGLMHVAASVGAFVVALYGPTNPAYTPPLTDNCQVMYLNLECSPCFSSECPLGHHNCLREITPDAVLETLLDKLLRYATLTTNAGTR